MSTVHAHLDEPLDEAATTLCQVAGEEGWALAEGKSSPPSSLVFGLYLVVMVALLVALID